MAFIDYYKILGVDKTIPQKDVKKAYLKRAKQFHVPSSFTLICIQMIRRRRLSSRRCRRRMM